MRSALFLLATIAATASGAAVDCDASYRCEYFFATSGALTEWNFEPLCSQAGYTHTETDRNATFNFNICGLSPVYCAPSIPNSTLPSYGVAVQEADGNCFIAGEGFPNFVPIDPTNPATGGINITHEAAPEPANSAKACADNNNRIVSRSTKYMMLCDPDADPLVVDSAYEETECQYVIVMRSKYGCGAANPASEGGNCLAPPQPPGLSATCTASTVTLSQAMLGYEAEFQAWNQACLESCDPTQAVTCSADCQNNIDEYLQDCTQSSGALYSFAQSVTFANGATVGITSYKCLSNDCTGDGDVNGFQAYASDTQCSIVDTSTEMPTGCSVAVAPSGIQPSPAPAPSINPSPCPSQSIQPSPPAPVPSPGSSPAASPSPSPSTAPADGGAVAGAIFATFAGLAVVVFGGYHIGTRSGYVRRESVPGGARFCLECECLNTLRNHPVFNRTRAGEATAFTSSSAVAGGAPAAATSSSFASTGGVGSGVPPAGGGGYQTI